MSWTILKTEADYNKANMRMISLFDAEPNSPEDDELSLLVLLIKDYDDRHYTLPEINVLDLIKEKMQERGLKNKDLQPIIGSKAYVSSVLSGKRDITLKMAQRLKDFFHIPAELFLKNVS